MSEDNENIKAAKDDAICTKGYFILPSQLFSNVAANAHNFNKDVAVMSLKREYASENGIVLNEALPKPSPLNLQYRTQRQTVLQKIPAFVEKFKCVEGKMSLA